MISQKLQEASTLSEVFELVKLAVWQMLGKDQAGLMVGLTDIPTENAWLGAYYSPDSNIIIMNKLPIRKLKQKSPELFVPYAFNVLLHEYIHSLGYYDEEEARRLTYAISRQLLGEGHIATQLALDINQFMEHINYAGMPVQSDAIEFLPGIDRKNTDYIM